MIFLGECSKRPKEKEPRGTEKSQGYMLFSYRCESTKDLFKDRKPAHLRAPESAGLISYQPLQLVLAATGWQCWSALRSHSAGPAKGSAALQHSSLNWVSRINLEFTIPTFLISCDLNFFKTFTKKPKQKNKANKKTQKTSNKQKATQKTKPTNKTTKPQPTTHQPCSHFLCIYISDRTVFGL